MTGASRPTTMWLTHGPRPVTDEDVSVVLDPTWTPDAVTAADGRVIPVRDAVDRLLGGFDPIVETSILLDRWAARSGVVPALTIGSTSFWYYVRLGHWVWLQERVLWAQVLRRLLDDHAPTRVVCGPGTDRALVEVARLMASADGLELEVEADQAGGDVGGSADVAEGESVDRGAAAPSPARARRRPAWRRILGRVRRTLGAGTRSAANPTLALVEARLAGLAREEPRLLVVLNHIPQRVETPTGPRLMNPFLGPVADRLGGTPLEPIFLDWHARMADASTTTRIVGPGTERNLPWDVIRLGDEPPDPEVAQRAALTARSLAEIREPVATAGIDLGPGLAREVGEAALRWLPGKQRSVARLGRLIRLLRPAGILVADEYHRQDWMEAATAAGVPIAAIQHGTINRHHRGYIHADRPPQLHLPGRTYVFGQWERTRLVHDSVYRDDEVVVAGSPRLDLYRAEAVDRDAVRAECGVAPGDRLVVLSGTWGEIYRRFHYPVVLARLFDRPLPRVHLVVKLHPAEPDEGPYRAVIEGVAAARGFAPPPITVVQDVDLYRLLAAADAHLGIHSTVLTEAVSVGTPNLLATGILGGDLLDYVEGAVALPVTSGEELLAALDDASTGAITADARAAFLAYHFEPGSATERIAGDLLAWMSPPTPAIEGP